MSLLPFLETDQWTCSAGQVQAVVFTWVSLGRQGEGGPPAVADAPSALSIHGRDWS